MLLLDHRIVLDGTGENNAAYLICFGDIHCDSSNYNPAVLSRVISELQSLPNSYAICTGDVFEFCNSRTRSAISSSLTSTPGGDEASLVMDSMMRKSVSGLEKTLKEAGEGKFLAFCLGNHAYKYQDNIFSDEDLARRLGSSFTDGVLALRITLATKPPRRLKSDSGNKTARINLVAHHGTGGSGSTEGGDLQALWKRANIFTNSHIHISGHTHHCFCIPQKAELEFGNAATFHIKETVRWLARCGSCVRSYSVGERANYIERIMAHPQNTGFVVFKCWIRRERNKDGSDIKSPHIEGKVILVK